jgi:UDP:flavonoid glycosyltransferase YjiC (YdhE family)
VVLPQLDDQFDNADAVVKAGAGIRLLPEETNPAAVVRACWEVLGDDSHIAAANAMAHEIAAQPGPAEIATLLGCLV